MPLHSLRERICHGKETRWPLAVLATLALAAGATAQEAPPVANPPAAKEPEAESSSWEFGLSGALYVLPDEADFVQPTFKADRGLSPFRDPVQLRGPRLGVLLRRGELRARGDKVKLALTPMVGGLVGQTDGIIPALEADLTVGPFEAYGEAEYVFDLNDSSSKYFYMWSELSVWPTEWLRAGMVTQRTRVYQTERDIQRGAARGGVVQEGRRCRLLLQPGQRRPLHRGVARRVLLITFRSPGRRGGPPEPPPCVAGEAW